MKYSKAGGVVGGRTGAGAEALSHWREWGRQQWPWLTVLTAGSNPSGLSHSRTPLRAPWPLWPDSFANLVLAGWSPDGRRLAVVHRAEGRRPVWLTILRRDGEIEQEMTIAPNGEVAAPQWMPDGRRLLVQTFPFGGRRILAVDVATGQVLDLSRLRWDAWFALAPDGRRLLLSNGRGGFWLSEFIVASDSR